MKVTSPIMLYSVPKHPEGLLIENMEGDVFKDVTNYKGKVLSANLPYVVKFVTQLAGVDVKFQAHLVSFPSPSETGTSRIARRTPHVPERVYHACRARRKSQPYELRLELRVHAHACMGSVQGIRPEAAAQAGALMHDGARRSQADEVLMGISLPVPV